MKERQMFLREEGFLQENTRLGEKQIRAIVLPIEKDFVIRICGSNMKSYRAFQKRYKEEGDNYKVRRDSLSRLQDAAYDIENEGELSSNSLNNDTEEDYSEQDGDDSYDEVVQSQIFRKKAPIESNWKTTYPENFDVK